MPGFRTDFWLANGLAAFAMFLNWCQQLHTTQQHAKFPCVSLTNTDDPNPLQGSKKNATVVANVSNMPAVKRTKKHISATNAHQFRPKHQFGLFSVVGWVWQHQNFTKRKEQTNLSLLREKRPGRPRMRAENAEKCNPDHWDRGLTFENLPQNCRRKPEIFT